MCAIAIASLAIPLLITITSIASNDDDDHHHHYSRRHHVYQRQEWRQQRISMEEYYDSGDADGMATTTDAISVYNIIEIEKKHDDDDDDLKNTTIRQNNDTAGVTITAATTVNIEKEKKNDDDDDDDDGGDNVVDTTNATIRQNNDDDTINHIIDAAPAAHNYGVLLTHYHKTGYVLSRNLMQLVIDLEYKARGMKSPLQSAKSKNLKMKIQKKKAVDHIDEDTGAQIAFGQRGNWKNSFVPARRHSAINGGCPPFFTLDVGAIHVQESPNLFCDDEQLYRLLFGVEGEEGSGGGGWKELFQYHIRSSSDNKNISRSGNSSSSYNSADDGGVPVNDAVLHSNVRVKIVHFIRNPFEMALSNYLYHSQEPTVSNEY